MGDNKCDWFGMFVKFGGSEIMGKKLDSLDAVEVEVEGSKLFCRFASEFSIVSICCTL